MRCPSCAAENDDAAEVCFNCRALLSAVTRGSLLSGRYEILSPLGRGGMGAVYRARDRVLEEEVAVKVLRGEVMSTLERARRFRSEIKLARQVSHWNVCRIHEYGEDGPLRFISMELVEGETLKDALERRGALPPAEAFDVAVQIAEGLAAVHQAGIVHRDLKSANIMLDRSGRVRVMDFGIAKREADAGSLASGYVVGSPEYMSPEQARGLPVDTRSDLYALGVVVFEAVTGEVPFRADTPVGTLLLHLSAAPPLEAPRVPPALRPVLRRALAKEPAERFASAREMAEALRAARREALGEAATRAGAPPRRRRGLLAALVVLGVLAAIGVPWTRRSHREGVAGPSPTVPPSPSPTPSITAGEPTPEREPPQSAPAPAVAAKPRSVEPSTIVAPRPRSTPGSSPGPVVVPTPPPTPMPTPIPTTPPTPVATPAPPPAPAREPEGALLVLVTPWADVSIDGRPVGQTPLTRIPLAAGSHDVVLTHPDYVPLSRRVTVRAGETLRLVVDLPSQGKRLSR